MPGCNQRSHGDNGAKRREVNNNRSHLIAPFDDFLYDFRELWGRHKPSPPFAAGSSGRTNQSRTSNLPQHWKVVFDVHHNLAISSPIAILFAALVVLLDLLGRILSRGRLIGFARQINVTRLDPIL